MQAVLQLIPLVEVKGFWPVSARLLDSMNDVASDAGVRSLLIIHGGDPVGVSFTQRRCMIFSIDLETFWKVSGRDRLVETLRRERNRVVHSAG